MKKTAVKSFSIAVMALFLFSSVSLAWNDETHLAIAKASGYHKWYNAAAADIIKIKIKDREDPNHYVNNTPGTVITPQMVLDQVKYYDRKDRTGHLYGAIIASFNHYLNAKKNGEYGESHMAFCAHYVGDLSMPLHNIYYDAYNKEHHKAMDGIINIEVLKNLKKIKLYSIRIDSENDLAVEIARIANISTQLGFQLDAENRSLKPEEAYRQIGYSASLLKAMLDYANAQIGR